MALNQKRGEMPYDSRCEILKLDTLQKRREYSSLIECYKRCLDLMVFHLMKFLNLDIDSKNSM